MNTPLSSAFQNLGNIWKKRKFYFGGIWHNPHLNTAGLASKWLGISDEPFLRAHMFHSQLCSYLVQEKPESKGANPQRVSTEIIIEIKQFNAGRMASHPFIEGIWCSH